MRNEYATGEEPERWDRVRIYVYGRYEYGVIDGALHKAAPAIVRWDDARISSLDWHKLELVKRQKR